MGISSTMLTATKHEVTEIKWRLAVNPPISSMYELQKLADFTGLMFRVRHYSPKTLK